MKSNKEVTLIIKTFIRIDCVVRLLKVLRGMQMDIQLLFVMMELIKRKIKSISFQNLLIWT